MKALLLSGIGCTHRIWQPFVKELAGWHLTALDYPHEVTIRAHGVKDLAKWLLETIDINEYDCAVGHSMGGLVLLEAFSMLSGLPLILVESNLRPADVFFHNLLTQEHMKAYGTELTDKMRPEFAYYTEELKGSLQDDFDYTGSVLQAKAKIYAVYGDRGVRPAQTEKLNLPPDVLKKIRLAFVDNCAHMPMLENPRQLSAIISRWMEEKKGSLR